MAGNSKQRDQLPDRFSNCAEAGDFWDTHDLTNYEDLTRELSFEVNLQRRVYLTALEAELAEKLTEYACKQGISTETLVNVWLAEKLMAVTEAQSR